MLRNCRPRYLERLGDVARRQFGVAYQFQNFAPIGLGDRAKYGVHDTYVSISLRKCQLTYRFRLPLAVGEFYGIRMGAQAGHGEDAQEWPGRQGREGQRPPAKVDEKWHKLD